MMNSMPTSASAMLDRGPVPAATGIDPAPGETVAPYVKVFGPDIGVLEMSIPFGGVTVGRSDDADVKFPDPTVSRTHARIRMESNEFVVADAGSTHGTLLNRKPVTSSPLRHGDNIQIGPYIIQFRTHAPIPGAAAAAARAKRLLQSNFATLPSGIQCRYRTLGITPEMIFQSGDTLRIGQGGLLLPAATPPEEGACLELQLAWGEQRTKHYLGEIVGVVEEEGIHWMCVKLHTVPADVHESTVQSRTRSQWTEVEPT